MTYQRVYNNSNMKGSLVKQELLTFQGHLTSSSSSFFFLLFGGIRVAQSLLFCVLFCILFFLWFTVSDYSCGIFKSFRTLHNSTMTRATWPISLWEFEFTNLLYIYFWLCDWLTRYPDYDFWIVLPLIDICRCCLWSWRNNTLP